MGGLYQRALNILNHKEPESQNLPEGITFEDDSGISIEEQKEIVSELNKLVSENKITINDEVLTIKPQKRGIFFPIIINLSAVALIIITFFSFRIFFASQEQKIMLESKANTGVEGELLSRFKQEKEQELNAKEQEIINIQSQLAKLDGEKEKLQANMDNEINTKKMELEKLMSMELEKERESLKARGISTEDINLKIEEMQRKKEIDFEKELDSFKLMAESQRSEDEKRIEKLKQEFSLDLDSINSEKEALKQEVQDYAKREQELKRQAAEREKELEKEKTAAEERLQLLTAQREREDLVNEQILGMYENVNILIKETKFDNALKSLSEMRGFFHDESTAALPAVLKRRNVELFIIDSLKNLIEAEDEKTKIDTESLLKKANLISSISTKVAEAENLHKQNKISEAQALYKEALAVIPEVRKSFEAINKIESGGINQVFLDYYYRGDEDFLHNDYASAIENYSRALKLYPENPNIVDVMMTKIAEAGYKLKGSRTAQVDEETKADTLLTEANTALGNIDYEKAVNAYLEILTKYPRTSQVLSAQNGIKTAIQRQTSALSTDKASFIAGNEKIITEKEAIILEKNRAISEKDSIIADRNSLLKKKDEIIAQKDSRISNLESTLEQKAGLIEKLESSVSIKDRTIGQKEGDESRLKQVEKELMDKISELEKEKVLLNSEIASLKEDVEKNSTILSPTPVPKIVYVEKEKSGAYISEEELKEFNKLKNQILEIKQKYNEYAMKENEIIARQGDLGYLTTKPILGNILTADFVKELFPDLYERIKSFELALAEDARKDGEYVAIDNILNIIYERLTLSSGVKPGDFWNDLREKNKNDYIFLDLIDELEDLLEK